MNHPIYTRYIQAEQVLTARMVGEYWKMDRLHSDLSPDMFQGENKAARTMLDLLKQGRSVVLFVLSQASGIPEDQLNSLGNQHPDVPIETAIEEFTIRHGEWVEYEISISVPSWIESGRSIEWIKTESERVRRTRRTHVFREEENALGEFMSRLEDALAGRIPTGKIEPPIASLRSHIPFHEGGELTIIAGRPGMGKSKFALNYLMYNVHNNRRGKLFSLEMPGHSIYKWLWQMLSDQGFQYDMSALPEPQKAELRHLAKSMENMHLKVSSVEFGLSGILSSIRRAYYDTGLEFAIVDYMQLMEDESMGKNSNRENEVAKLSRQIKKCAMELNIPIFALSQLSREVEKRGGSMRPKLSDLRESGAVEQDASNVFFPYRPEHYNISGDGKNKYPEGYAEVIVAKAREHGPTIAKCRFNHIKGYYDTPIDTSLFPEDPPY